jgi:hypothetical protein
MLDNHDCPEHCVMTVSPFCENDKDTMNVTSVCYVCFTVWGRWTYVTCEAVIQQTAVSLFELHLEVGTEKLRHLISSNEMCFTNAIFHHWLRFQLQTEGRTTWKTFQSLKKLLAIIYAIECYCTQVLTDNTASKAHIHRTQVRYVYCAASSTRFCLQDHLQEYRTAPKVSAFRTIFRNTVLHQQFLHWPLTPF